jgi:hypothetical protein
MYVSGCLSSWPEKQVASRLSKSHAFASDKIFIRQDVTRATGGIYLLKLPSRIEEIIKSQCDYSVL